MENNRNNRYNRPFGSNYRFLGDRIGDWRRGSYYQNGSILPTRKSLVQVK